MTFIVVSSIQVLDEGVGCNNKEPPHKHDEVLDRLKATETECGHLRTRCQVTNLPFVLFIISFVTWNLTLTVKRQRVCWIFLSNFLITRLYFCFS